MSFTEPLGAPDDGDSFSASRTPMDLPNPPDYEDEVIEDDDIVDDEILGDTYVDEDLDDLDLDDETDETDEIGPEDEDFTETENLSSEPT